MDLRMHRDRHFVRIDFFERPLGQMDLGFSKLVTRIAHCFGDIHGAHRAEQLAFLAYSQPEPWQVHASDRQTTTDNDRQQFVFP